MGDHEHGQPQRLLQRLDQRVEIAGGDRIEARGRLVEEHDLGIERERARQRHALGHAAGQLGGKLVAVVRRQPDHLELGDGDLVHQPLRQVEILAHRKLDVLPHGERGEQRALLEQDAPAPRAMAPRRRVALIEIDAHHLDRAALPLGHQADDGAHQHRLAAARSADETEDLAAPDVEIEMVEHDVAAEADHEVAHADRVMFGVSASLTFRSRRRRWRTRRRARSPGRST